MKRPTGDVNPRRFNVPQPDPSTFYEVPNFKIPDPFKYLEEFRDETGAIKPEIKEWIDAENDRTHRELNKHFSLDTLLEYAKEAQSQRVFTPSAGMATGPFLSMKEKYDSLRDRFFRVVGEDSETVRLIATRSGRETVVFDTSRYTPFGNRPAFRSADFDTEGNNFLCKMYLRFLERSVACVIDATGRIIDGPFFFDSCKISAWLPDASGFYYRDERKDQSIIRFHRIGDPMDADAVVFTEQKHAGGLRLRFYKALPGNIVSAYLSCKRSMEKKERWLIFDGNRPEKPYFLSLPKDLPMASIIGQDQGFLYLAFSKRDYKTDIYKMELQDRNSPPPVRILSNLETTDVINVKLSKSRIVTIEPFGLCGE